MSKKRRLQEGVERRTSGSVYNANGIQLGDEFLQELTGPADSALQVGDGTLRVGRATLTARGLITPDDIEEPEYVEIGRVLLHLDGAIQWLLGDWLARGDERQWGETYRQVAAEFGREVTTLRNYVSVCNAFDNLSRRRDDLSFGHHQAVVGLSTAADQDDWLERAAAEGWSVARLRREVAGARRVDDPFIRWRKTMIRRIHDDLKQMKPHERQQIIDDLRDIIDTFS